MIIKRHDCKLTERMIRHIEYVLPKLKYSVYFQQVRSWLENFEENEVELALDFLFYLEYISFPELQIRLDIQLNYLDKYFGEEKKYVLVPYADYAKSNDIVAYLIAKSPTYQRLFKEKRISFTVDVKNYAFSSDVVLVFIDDFIGSAKSFQKWYKKNEVAKFYYTNPKPYEEQAILAAIIMEDGYEFLKHQFPEVRVFAELRSKVFCPQNSPFNLLENRVAMRRLCIKYGSIIRTGFTPPNKVLYSPLGYDKSEALVAFDYGTPNNSLSIIWGDQEWNPIYPRSANSRMKKAAKIKGEAAFYLGLMHKLGINFKNDLNINIGERIISLSARDDHSILVCLILLDKHYHHLQICQILGITFSELDKIILNAHKKRLTTREGKLSGNGIKFLTEMKRIKNIFSFRENDTLEIRDNNIFVPKTFKGLDIAG